MRKRHKRLIPHIVAILALFGLALVSGLMWMESKERFPLVGKGVYTGTVKGVFGNTESAPLYVERREEASFVLLVIAYPGLLPTQLHIPSDATEYLSSAAIAGDAVNIRLDGGALGEGRFGGIANNISTGERGRWEIAPVNKVLTVLSNSDTEKVTHWLRLKDEAAGVIAQIDEVEQRVKAQKDEIDKLTKFVTEREKLRTTSEAKYNQVRVELEKAQSELKGKQDTARRLEERLTVAQRVTPMGRLVSLARESLERESRWIDSMFRASVQVGSPDFEQEFSDAEKIYTIRRELTLERAKIARLHKGEGEEEEVAKEEVVEEGGNAQKDL